MFFLVVALLITGVYAVTSANVNIGGTISFNATNIYATITGTITGASNSTTLSPLNYSAKTQPSQTELNTWCQNLTFADATIPTVKWTIQIENKSERALYVTLTDNIATLTNATKTLTFDGGSATGEQTIPAKTTKTYTMEIKVTDTNASASIDYNFDFDLRDASVSQNQGGGSASSIDLKYDTTNNYYYVEMGTYNNAPVKWRLVGVDGEHFDGSTAPTSGKGTFILETLIIDNKQAFNASTSDGNDYADSDIRQYLKNDYVSYLNLTNDATYNAIAERSVAEMYTNIGWYTNSQGEKAPNDNLPSIVPMSAPSTYGEIYAIDTTNTESDKLWLMSVEEVYKLVGGGTITNNIVPTSSWSASVTNNLIWNQNNNSSSDYLLRSPEHFDSRRAIRIYSNGACQYDFVSDILGVRPAFNIEF